MKYIFLAILFRVLASVFLKQGADMVDFASPTSILTNITYLLSLFFLFLQAISWQMSLKEYNLSYAYMFMSLYYPLLLMVCCYYFNESISTKNIVGMFLIVTGVIYSRKTK